MIELKDVTKVYKSEEGDVKAVDGVTMEVGEGRSVFSWVPPAAGRRRSSA